MHDGSSIFRIVRLIWRHHLDLFFFSFLPWKFCRFFSSDRRKTPQAKPAVARCGLLKRKRRTQRRRRRRSRRRRRERRRRDGGEEKPTDVNWNVIFCPYFFFWFVSKAGNRKDRDGSSTPVSGSLPSFFLMDLKSRRWNLKRVLILGHFVASFSLHKIISNINVEETSRNDWGRQSNQGQKDTAKKIPQKKKKILDGGRTSDGSRLGKVRYIGRREKNGRETPWKWIFKKIIKWNKNKKETKIRNGHEEEENENRFFVPASRSSPRASPKEKRQKKKQKQKTKRIKLDKKKHGN